VEAPPGPRPEATPPRKETPPVAASEPGIRGQSADALSLGRDLLNRGEYGQASDAFRDYLYYRASSKYTIAVGLFCDSFNVTKAKQEAGAENLIVLMVPYRGRACYRVYWGLYDTLQAAELAMPTLPAALRSAGQAPVPVSRLLQ